MKFYLTRHAFNNYSIVGIAMLIFLIYAFLFAIMQFAMLLQVPRVYTRYFFTILRFHVRFDMHREIKFHILSNVTTRPKPYCDSTPSRCAEEDAR